MTTRTMKQALVAALICPSLITVAATAQEASSAPSTQQPVTGPAKSAPQTAAQLGALVAPIALYPDALVAQVLAAGAFPEQVALADDWLKQNGSLTGSALTSAVDQQSWDPSVKALTQFPSVLHNMAQNLAWTSNLGEAFSTQQADVMAAIQTMRAKAQTAGALKSSSQITVVQQSPSTIVIQPANPNIVYVPQYNPAVIYGEPVVIPYYVPPPVPFVISGVSFGSGVSIHVGFGGGCCWGGGGWGWGWHAWGVNWGAWGGGGGTVIYNHNTYINNRIVINNRTSNNTNNNYHYSNTTNNNYHGNTYNGGNSNGYRPNPASNAGNSGYHGPASTGFEHNEGSYSSHNLGSSAGRGDFSGREQQPRSFMSGNGDRDRAASARGWNSMRAMNSRPERMGGSRNMGGGSMGSGHFGGGGRRR